MARRHLAIFLKGIAEKILIGEKRVELRLSQSKIIPYLAVSKDDEILLKNSGGKILGQIEVDNVLYYDNLKEDDIEKLAEIYFVAAKMEQEFWQKKKNSRFATVIFLKNPRKYLSPLVFQKKDRRAWVVMENHEK